MKTKIDKDLLRVYQLFTLRKLALYDNFQDTAKDMERYGWIHFMSADNPDSETLLLITDDGIQHLLECYLA